MGRGKKGIGRGGNDSVEITGEKRTGSREDLRKGARED